MNTIKGPAGFDEARKEPTNWEARRTKGGWFAFRGGWESWRYDELTHPDTEWRRVAVEPMRVESKPQLLLGKDGGCVIQMEIGAEWVGKRARIIVEEVTDAKPEQPDPPAEMTAEQAHNYLSENGRFVVDCNGHVFRCVDRDALDAQDEPYTPLAPVTRWQMTRVEGLEKCPPWLTDAAKALGEVCPDGTALALNWTQVIEGIADVRRRLSRATYALQRAKEAMVIFTKDSAVKQLVEETLRELRATKEGAGG